MLVSRGNMLAALLHDASEAYLIDIPSPIKQKLSNYKEIEDGLMQVISKKFGFLWPLNEEIKDADKECLEYEWEIYMLNLDDDNFGMKQSDAKNQFLKMFNNLTP